MEGRQESVDGFHKNPSGNFDSKGKILKQKRIYPQPEGRSEEFLFEFTEILHM